MSEQMQARYERQLLQWQHSSNYWYSQFSLCQAERDILRRKYEASQKVLCNMFEEFEAAAVVLGAGEEEPVIDAAKRVRAEAQEALKRAAAAESELWYSQHMVADLRNQIAAQLTAQKGPQ